MKKHTIALFVVCSLMINTSTSIAQPQEEKPNILVFICDQLNAKALSCYGGPVSTPNIDKLASKGLLFNDAICSTPVCSPSRASLVMGNYPHEHGIIHNCMLYDYPATANSRPKTEEGVTNEDVTIDRLLYENGYQAYQFGKWHLTGEKLDYFDTNYGEHHEYAEEMAPIFEKVQKLPRDTWMDWYGWILPVKQTQSFLDVVSQTSPDFRANKYSDFVTKIGQMKITIDKNFDVRVADKSIETIKKMNNKPFILTCSFNYPHDPNVVPSPYYDMFDLDKIKLPDNYRNSNSYFCKSWSSKIVRELGEVGVREFLRNYYASVKLIDDQVGRVLRTLKQSGKLNNTIIVFTSDHGDMMGSHKMIWKSNSSFYDEIVKIPLIIYYPEKIKPHKADFPINIADIPVSLLAFSGIEKPVQMVGNDLSSFMTGEKNADEAPKYVLCERMSPHPNHLRKVEPGRPGSFMIRGEGWKYALYKDGKEFLYDLENDPMELDNQADNPECLDKKSEMHNNLIELLRKTNYNF